MWLKPHHERLLCWIMLAVWAVAMGAYVAREWRRPIFSTFVNAAQVTEPSESPLDDTEVEYWLDDMEDESFTPAIPPHFRQEPVVSAE